MKPREKAEMCARVREIRKMQHAVWRRTKMSYFSKKSNGCEYVNSVGTFFLHTCSRNTPIAFKHAILHPKVEKIRFRNIHTCSRNKSI